MTNLEVGLLLACLIFLLAFVGMSWDSRMLKRRLMDAEGHLAAQRDMLFDHEESIKHLQTKVSMAEQQVGIKNRDMWR